MFGTTLSIAAFLFNAVASGAEEPPARPYGPPPTKAVVQQIMNGEHVIVQATITVTKYVAETRTRIVMRNGRQVPETYTVMRPVSEYVQMVNAYPLDGLQVTDLDGKAVAPKDVPTVLKAGAAVLISVNGKRIDPAYLVDAKKGSYILIPKKGEAKELPADKR